MNDCRIKVSVIIPVYNAGEYLKPCLESIVHQTLRDIEIICVNDGSTDDSLSVIKGQAERDSRFVVIDQKNAGAGAARNTGLKAARGEYLSFLDSDDFFDSTMLEKAYSGCLENNLDFIVFRSDVYNNAKNSFEPCSWTVKDYLVPDQSPFCYRDIKRDIFRVFIGWAWDKLYRKDFVVDNDLYFQEQRTSNDLFFVFSALVAAEKIAVLDDVLAHHRRNVSGSLSVTREKSWNCFYEALTLIRTKLNDLGIYEEIKRDYINYALHFALWNLNTICGENYRILYNKLKNEYFNDLGVSSYPEDYFYHVKEYKQYLDINELSFDEYVSGKNKHRKSSVVFRYMRRVLGAGGQKIEKTKAK